MFELRDYQKPIPEKVFDYMRRNPDKHPLIALPTGSGKTVVLSDLILKAISKWPNTKILVLSHVKEILEQNYEAIKYHTGADIGLFSAGLNSREIKQITIAGIQSVYRCPEMFKEFKLIIIDECHLIPQGGNSMYRTFFKGLNNPRYFGLTATPYRLGQGKIYGTDDAIFHDLIYDYTYMDRFNSLIDAGYLCPLRVKAPRHELDTTGIHTTGGDFDLKEMSSAFNREAITRSCISELVKAGEDYKRWLIFAIDIDHAESIAECLLRVHNIDTMVIHSEMTFDRAKVLEDSKKGKYRAIVNVNVLTTGYNDPEIDLIALMRPTKSPVIHVQTIGRGLRIAPGKDHCLIMDFAGNTERLGPINDIHVHRKSKSEGPGEPITKRCPNCNTIHHPTVKICNVCEHVFLFKTDLKVHRSATEVIKTNKKLWYEVDDIQYTRHDKKFSPSMVKVTYVCGFMTFQEYLCIEHPGWPGYKAKHWIKYRGGEGLTVDEVLKHKDKMKVPKKILIDRTRKYPTVIEYTF